LPTTISYAVVCSLARVLLGLFYERIDVVGAERVPPTGPLIVAANHHNSLVDAMLLLAVVPRRLRTLANAPLFRNPLLGPLLRLLGALPVHRRQEAGDDPARNATLFAATTATLGAGGAILIFPEGRTQPEPVLLTLRTGAARMLLAAEQGSAAASTTLLPVGLVFHEPGTFRTGRALVMIGMPVPAEDARALAAAGSPEEAARLLTERLTEALRAQIVEADDRDTLRLLGLVEELWNEETGTRHGDETARVAWLQRVMGTYRLALVREPSRIAGFRKELEEFTGDMERAGLAARQLSREYSPWVVARHALHEGLSLLLGAPLALLGIAAHVIPYVLTGWAVRWLDRTAEEEATDKIAAGLILYPLAWAAEAWCVLHLCGGVGLGVFLVALLPTGFFALAWRERLDRVGGEARAFVHFLNDRDLPRRLRERRRALATELRALARSAPELWPE
jgi:glycerol-3-phosphate O-acyltransferase / dihydroxyacetone phosphate acyltransferase